MDLRILLLRSSMVEQPAVNRLVGGSSPPGGAILYPERNTLILWLTTPGIPFFSYPFRIPPRTEKDKDRKVKISVMRLKAEEWTELLESGHVRNKAEIARMQGVSRAYVTKVFRYFNSTKSELY